MNKSYGIHDKWTDLNKVNNIRVDSVNGVVENITVNGEPAGGGGFSTAKVTVVGKARTTFFGSDNGNYSPIYALLEYDNHFYRGINFGENPVGDTTYNVYMIETSEELPAFEFDTLDESKSVTASGNCTIQKYDTDYIVLFTGDCTITIS